MNIYYFAIPRLKMMPVIVQNLTVSRRQRPDMPVDRHTLSLVECQKQYCRMREIVRLELVNPKILFYKKNCHTR
jgi:hypothetical protein